MTSAITTSTLKRFIHRKYGELSAGEHEEGQGAACILEAAAEWRGRGWSDDPDLLGVPDIRPLNDGFQDNKARTEAMVRLYALIEDWAEWPASRRLRFAERVVLRTAREVLPAALRAADMDDYAARLERASDLHEVRPVAAEAAEQLGVLLAGSAARHTDVACQEIDYFESEVAARQAAFAAYCAASAAPTTYEEDALATRAAEIWIEAAKAARSG